MPARDRAADAFPGHPRIQDTATAVLVAKLCERNFDSIQEDKSIQRDRHHPLRPAIFRDRVRKRREDLAFELKSGGAMTEIGLFGRNKRLGDNGVKAGHVGRD